MGALSHFTGQIFEWPYLPQVAATCIQELSISQQKHSASHSNISKLDYYVQIKSEFSFTLMKCLNWHIYHKKQQHLSGNYLTGSKRQCTAHS